MGEELPEMPAEIESADREVPEPEACEEAPTPAPITPPPNTPEGVSAPKRGRPKKEPAPKPEPKARGRPRKVPLEMQTPVAAEAQSMEMSYEDMFSMLASRLQQEKTRKRDERLKKWDAFLPM